MTRVSSGQVGGCCINLPFCEEFVVDRVLGYHVGAILGSKEIAELCPSGYGFTELKVNGVWHDDCFLLYHFRQAQQVPGGDCTNIFELAGAMAHEPSNDCARVFFILNVKVEERRGDASLRWGRLMRDGEQHIWVGTAGRM